MTRFSWLLFKTNLDHSPRKKTKKKSLPLHQFRGKGWRWRSLPPTFPVDKLSDNSRGLELKDFDRNDDSVKWVTVKLHAAHVGLFGCFKRVNQPESFGKWLEWAPPPKKKPGPTCAAE